MISFEQSPTGVLPAYNDHYLIFSSDIQDEYAIINVGVSEFKIFPDLEGKYYFNIKKIVQTLINTNKFRDNLDVSTPNVWGFVDNSLYSKVTINISVHGDNIQESTSKVYEFIKSVNQAGDDENTNNYAVLLPSEGGNSYNVSYWEGFPFDFTIKRPSKDDVITLYNHNNNSTTPQLTPNATSSYRIILDKVFSNVMDDGFLPMLPITNRIDIRKAGVVQSTVNIKRKNQDCGVYLKWFNSQGGYSYFLFEQFFQDSTKTKLGDFIGSNNFKGVYDDNTGPLILSGKEATRVLNVKTMADLEDINHLRSLIMSPHVQMWSSTEAYSQARWIDVTIDSKDFGHFNKKYKNEIRCSIELPEINTQKI